MSERPEISNDRAGPRWDTELVVSEADSWFIREVLPLEATLMLFLRQNCRNKAEIADLRFARRGEYGLGARLPS